MPRRASASSSSSSRVIPTERDDVENAENVVDVISSGSSTLYSFHTDLQIFPTSAISVPVVPDKIQHKWLELSAEIRNQLIKCVMRLCLTKGANRDSIK